MKTIRVHVRIRISSRSFKYAWRDMDAENYSKAEDNLRTALLTEKISGMTILANNIEFLGGHEINENCKYCPAAEVHKVRHKIKSRLL